jgi:hypothetical protein
MRDTSAGHGAPPSPPPSPGSRAARLARDLVAVRAAPLLRAELSFLGALVVGVLLRIDQLGLQIVADDEWHALVAVKRGGFGEIASHFGGADYSIPLALWDELLTRTVGLSELGMRLPPLVFGLAALIALPLLLRRHVSKPATDAFAWLLAISPLHIYFTRYARPYSASFFLETVGVLAILQWWSRPKWTLAALYVFCATLGSYLHLMAGPFLVAPFLFFALERAIRGRREGGASFPQLVALAGITVLSLASVLAVPLVTDWGSISCKVERNHLDPASFEPTLELFTGAPTRALRIVFALASIVGLATAIRRRSRLIGYLAFLLLWQCVAVVATGPQVIEVAIVLARYTLPCLVFLLLTAAIGLARIDAWCREHWEHFPPAFAVYALPLTMLLLGPLWSTTQHPNNWTNHAWYQYQYSTEGRRYFEEQTLVPRYASSFYAKLSEFPPESFLIVEAPWHFPWQSCEYALFQREHRQQMLIAFLGDSPATVAYDEVPLRGEGFEFQNFVHISDIAGMRKRGVRFVILHRRFKAEARSPSNQEPIDLHPWIRYYVEEVGQPVHFDDAVTVFDLTPVER